MPTGEEIVRGFLGPEVGNLLRFDPVVRRGVDAEGVHQMRVNARHLRSELHVVSPILKSKARKFLDKELKWLGGALGRLRDLDVLEELLRSDDECPPFIVTTVLPTLEQHRGVERRKVARVLDSSRYRRLMARLSTAVVQPPLRAGASKPADEVLLPGLRRVLEHLASDLDQFGPKPSFLQLHLLRIGAKKGRYNCEIASSFIPEAGGVATSLEKVQTILGDLHDRTVAIAFLERALSKHRDDPSTPTALSDVASTVEHLNHSIKRLESRWRTPLTHALDASAPFITRTQSDSSASPESPVT
jgi:CHAD domain-containing protein